MANQDYDKVDFKGLFYEPDPRNPGQSRPRRVSCCTTTLVVMAIILWIIKEIVRG